MKKMTSSGIHTMRQYGHANRTPADRAESNLEPDDAFRTSLMGGQHL